MATALRLDPPRVTRPPDARPATVADLDAKQLSVVALVARGWADKRIAGALGKGMSERMVRLHITKIAGLIDVDPSCNTRMQIAFWFRAQCPVNVSDAALPEPITEER